MSFSTSERFSALEAKDRDRLEALAKLDEFKAGQQILSSDAPGEWLYLIASGSVELRAGGATLATFGQGDLFGELESFAGLPPGIAHVAREDTIVRVIPKAPLRQAMKERRPLATGLLSVYCRSISEKVRAANEVVARLGQAVAPSPGRDRAPHVSEEEAAWLQLLGTPLELPEGQTVVAEGDKSRAFFVIGSGSCQVRKRAPGGDRTLATLGVRDLFGFMAFVDGKPRSASVLTASPARLTRIEADALDKALHLNFTVGFKFLGTLCGVLGRTFCETAAAVIPAGTRPP